MPRAESGLHEEPDLDAIASAWHALDALVKDDLKALCVQRGLADTGTKQELARLLVSDGLKSTDLTLEQLHRIAAHGAYAIAWFRVLPRAELTIIIAAHGLPIDPKSRDIPTQLHKELSKDKYRFPPLPISPRAAVPIAKQRSTDAVATAAQRVATATATFVRTHLATEPEAVADVVAQLSTKLALNPGSLSPRAVEAALQRTPRAAASALQ